MGSSRYRLPRCPECAGVVDGQIARLVGETGADARIGVILVPLPTLQHRADDADHARTIDLEIPLEGPQQKLAFLAVADVRVPEIELQLSMNIGPTNSAIPSSVPLASCSAYRGVPGMGV